MRGLILRIRPEVGRPLREGIVADLGEQRVVVQLRPGIPGLQVDPTSTVYPPLTDEFATILHDLGCDVQFTVGAAERQTTSLRAGEIWVPVLQVSETVVLGLVGSLVAEAITRLIDRVRRSKQAGGTDSDLDVHVLIRRGPDGGEVKWIDLHGDASKVVESLRTLAD
jgi:hypothetical protein